MLIGKGTFLYLSRKQGVNSDGEKYLSVTVLDDDDKKYSFITKDENLITDILQKNFVKYSEVTVSVGFSRVMNKNRYYNWTDVLLGVE